MNSNTNPHPNDNVSDNLNKAYSAVATLDRHGITIYAALIVGDRRPTLVVSRIPDGVESAVKQRHPNGSGGTTVVRAALFMGCQLEYSQDVVSEAQAARIGAALASGGNHLQVVR